HGRLPHPREMIVERSIAARNRLQLVIEVEHDLVERKFIGEHDARRTDVFKRLLLAALLFDQLENSAYELLVSENRGSNDRLFDLFDQRWVGPARWVIDFDDGIVGQRDLVAHAWSRCDEVKVVLSLQALLDDLHVKETEKAAAKAEAERGRAFRL